MQRHLLESDQGTYLINLLTTIGEGLDAPGARLLQDLMTTVGLTPQNTGKLIQVAREKYQSSDKCKSVAIDDDACISPSMDGTWVQAWVWVAEAEVR